MADKPCHSFASDDSDATSTGRSQNETNNSDFLSNNLLPDFVQFLIDNFQQMTLAHKETNRLLEDNKQQFMEAHKETNRLLEAHNQQFVEVRKYAEATRNEVNKLTDEVSDFRKECDLRFKKLETLSSSDTGIGTRTRSRTANVNPESTVAPPADGPVRSYSKGKNLEAIRPSGKVAYGKVQKKTQRESCSYCGKLLTKSYLPKHKKYHCSAARECSV